MKMFASKSARAMLWTFTLAWMLAGAAQAQRSGSYRTVSLPKGTVLRAELNDTLSSTNSRVGDRFTGTIRDDGSGLPSGTRVIGRVTDVRTSSDNHPGVVDVAFQSLQLPDDRTYPIQGQLTSLDSKDVRRTSSGRLEARHSSRNKYQFLGYGAGAGAIISALTGGSLLKGALLGAIAGFAYQQLNKDKEANGHYSEVNLKPGTEFGVLLNHGTTVRLAENPYDGYSDRYASREDYSRASSSNGGGEAYPDRTSGWNSSSADYRERTAGSFQEYPGTIRVLVNGQEVRFADRGPSMAQGAVSVPLAPVLDTAGYRYGFDPRYREVTVFSDTGEGRMTIGDTRAWINGTWKQMGAPAGEVNGAIYVPVRFLEEAAGMRANWDPTTHVLRLTTRSSEGS